MNLTRFENFLKEKTEEKIAAAPEKIAAGIRYCLFDGGKRIRPMMLLHSAQMFSAPDKSVYYFAAAVECYHNFTLVHDDLPCMDDDDYRRGKPSCHKVFGEGQAVLIGDALQTLAFSFIADALAVSPDSSHAIEALGKFCDLTGAGGLIGGQSVDIDADNLNSPAAVDYIYKHKTGDLFCAAVVIGALLGGASPEKVDDLSRFAYLYGYIFQLTDDLLDQNKDEYHSILSYATREDIAQKLSDCKAQAELILNKMEEDTGYFYDLLQKTLSRKK